MSLSMSRFIGAPSLSCSTAVNVNSISDASIFSKKKYLALCSAHGFMSSRRLQYDPMLMITRRNFAVCSSNITPPPGVPVPSGSPSGSNMKGWVLGIVFTFVIPFFTHKWGPLILLKNKVDTMMDTTEYIVEAIAEVAGKVDKVIDNITDDLPQNSKLRKTLEALDEVVEGVAKTAHLADDLIDKVQEAEDKLESMIISEAKEEKVSKQIVEEVGVPTNENSTVKIE